MHATEGMATRRPFVGQTPLVTLAIVAVLVCQQWLFPLFDSDSVGTWSTIFIAIVVQSLPFLIGGVLLSAGISTFISERALRRIQPKQPALAVPVAGIAGMALPGCECAAVPVAQSLVNKGVAPAAALTFMLAAPAVNPAVLVSTAVAFPGRPEFVLGRFAASLLTAVVVGWFILLLRGRLSVRQTTTGAGHGENGFWHNVTHDFLHASGFLVLGAMLAAAVNTFVPRDVLDAVAGHPLLGILTLAVFAFVVALCSESDAFVAASMSAFSDTAKLVFLVVGPAMDIKLAALESGQFGGRFASAFVPLVLVVAITMAVLVGAVIL